MRRRRTAVIASSLLVGGCGSPAQPEIRQNVVEPRRFDPAVEVTTLLAKDAVDPQRFARATLYTWTTGEQIDELRRSRVLLSRDESPVSGASFVDQVLHALSLRGDALATLLYTTTFAKMRFAWPSPWATRAGWGNEKYGDQLIRVTLRPDAYIVSLSTATGAFEVHDLHDDIVPLATVLAKPGRIAAIYFVSDTARPPAPGLPRPFASFREYVLCNEAMIEAYEVGTARVAREVDQAAATVDAIARYVESAHPIVTTQVSAAWRTPGKGPVAVYHASLALDSKLYALDLPTLRELAAELRATPKPTAIEGAPAVAFAPGTARKPPRIVNHYGDASFARPPSPTAARP